MIELTEEPYDSEAALALVAALHREIDERYGHEMADWTPEEREADTDGYLGEVTPELTTRPRGVFLVARVDGSPVGCGALKPLDDSVGVAEVKRMYTAPHGRRQGVGRAVLARLEEVAAELGYDRMQLETGTAQPEALAMYATQGWRRIPSYGRYKGAPSSVCFAKDLPAT